MTSKRRIAVTARNLTGLSEEQSRDLLLTYDKDRQREHDYAVRGMFCGTVSFLALLGIFALLVLHGHTQAAAWLLGTSAIGTIGLMVRSRLS